MSGRKPGARPGAQRGAVVRSHAQRLRVIEGADNAVDKYQNMVREKVLQLYTTQSGSELRLCIVARSKLKTMVTTFRVTVHTRRLAVDDLAVLAEMPRGAQGEQFWRVEKTLRCCVTAFAAGLRMVGAARRFVDTGAVEEGKATDATRYKRE